VGAQSVVFAGFDGGCGSLGPSCAVELRRLRTRAATTLINIAMFGAFSSGKSSLVSGLQGKLEVIESVDRDGAPAEEFVGILPAAPEPANACPAWVVPIAGTLRSTRPSEDSCASGSLS
jgi:hypothetical protein